MADERDERLWTARLRWRLRGAWQAPAFALLTIVEALLFHWLPYTGEEGLDLFGAVLLAGFANLAICAAVGPLLGRLLRRRRPELPVDIARDRASSVFMAAFALLVLVGGVANRSTVTDADADAARQLSAVRAYVAHHGPAEYQAGAASPNVWKLAEHRYRTCVPGKDPRRALCLYVRTDEPQPVVRVDDSQEPNSVLAGPDNPGRQGG